MLKGSKLEAEDQKYFQKFIVDQSSRFNFLLYLSKLRLKGLNLFDDEAFSSVCFLFETLIETMFVQKMTDLASLDIIVDLAMTFYKYREDAMYAKYFIQDVLIKQRSLDSREFWKSLMNCVILISQTQRGG